MSRRTIILSVTLLLLVAVIVSMGAFAANTSSLPINKVTANIHKLGNDGYFMVTLPLKESDALSTRSLIKVVKGDVWLVNSYINESSDEPGDKPEPEIVVTGRFEKSGEVQLQVSACKPDEAFKPLANISFTLSSSEQNNPKVASEWAKYELNTLCNADPKGEDSFRQYWDNVIAPKYNVTGYLQQRRRGREEAPDLYSIFSGAAAIQESLQLDALQNSVANKNSHTIPLSDLIGPDVKSHPFSEMLKGKNPQLPKLASLIPDDQYAVFFNDINKQFELADLIDEWGGNLLQQMESSARDFKVRQKTSRQLCLESSWLARMFGNRIIADMAFTGNDPFLKEGTAFTVLFSLKDKNSFLKQIENNYIEAGKKYNGTRSKFTVNKLSGLSVVSADRKISSYTLLIDDVAIVSNSLAAVTRISDVYLKSSKSLADSDDFRYMRTIFPQNAAEEDIFIYLSDAHIRNLVGPRWKIGEARRLHALADLTLLSNARLWFMAEKRREPTLKELSDGGYLGQDPSARFTDGNYGFDKAGQAYSKLYNRQGCMTPIGEVAMERVTSEEANEYRTFVSNYNRYWTKFFDPIGIRIKMGKDIRIQTCILPLIENSWYDGFSAFSGTKAGELTENALLPRTIASFRGHASDKTLKSILAYRRMSEKTDWLGNEITLNLCDGQVFFSSGREAAGYLNRELEKASFYNLAIGFISAAVNLPTYLTAKVTDVKKAEKEMPYLFEALAPQAIRDFSIETYSIEGYGNKTVYVTNLDLWLFKLRIYSAIIGDRLVIASRKDIITDLIDGKVADKKLVKNDGNFEMSVYRSAFKQIKDHVNLGWQEDMRKACHANLPLESLLNHLGISGNRVESTIFDLRGYELYCPAGGKHTFDEATGFYSCSLHGTVWDPKQPARSDEKSKAITFINSLDQINARLAFTPEGLMTTVDIKRK